MNKDRVLQMAGVLDNQELPVRFDMRLELACIAGLTCLLFGEPDMIVTMATAAELLDISLDRAKYLFHGKWSGKSLCDITRHDAAAELRRMAAV